MYKVRGSKYQKVCIKNAHSDVKAEQHHASRLDINNMIAEFTGKEFKKEQLEQMLNQLERVNALSPSMQKRYGTDMPPVSNDLAFHSHRLSAIKKMFECNVPGLIKEKFNHNPFEFYAFVNNPQNKEAVEKMFTNFNNYTFTRYDG